MDIFYFDWSEEAVAGAETLRAAGHTVRLHSTPGGYALPDPPPAAVVISLERLPSHGREVAQWFWQAKKRQSIPIVFVGGEAAKVAALQAKFPRALFCSREKLPAVLASI
jgi:hypothetical protein